MYIALFSAFRLIKQLAGLLEIILFAESAGAKCRTRKRHQPFLLMEREDPGNGVCAAGGSFKKVTGKAVVKDVESEMRLLKIENVRPDSKRIIKTV